MLICSIGGTRAYRAIRAEFCTEVRKFRRWILRSSTCKKNNNFPKKNYWPPVCENEHTCMHLSRHIQNPQTSSKMIEFSKISKIQNGVTESNTHFKPKCPPLRHRGRKLLTTWCKIDLPPNPIWKCDSGKSFKQKYINISPSFSGGKCG